MISNTGISFIQKWEELRLKAYKDPIGIWTIGWGHIDGVYEGQTITKNQALEFLRQDLSEAQKAVDNFVIKKNIPLQGHQYDALVSLVFNVGSGNIFTKNYSNGYASGSTLYNKLLMLDFEGAAKRFTDFVKAGGETLNGLVRRREMERDMFLKKKVK